jgi:hypothetical protein
MGTGLVLPDMYKEVKEFPDKGPRGRYSAHIAEIVSKGRGK